MPLILIVEDDPALANLYDKILKNHEFETIVARDGLAGLEEATNKNPDCIILDVRLPKLNGMDLYEKLIANPMKRKIPVIFLTNNTDPAEKEKALSLGAKDYLAKAMFSSEDIVSKIKKYIGATEA